MNAINRKISAWLPILLSLAMMGVLLYFVKSNGGVAQPEADEGTGAHLFQIWLAVESLMLLFFALRWLPKAPRQGFFILTLQILAILLVAFPVFYFQL